MNSDSNNARVAGFLFLVALLAGIASLPFAGLVKQSDYLVTAAQDGNLLMAGALLELIMAFACAGIAIWLYPALKRQSSAMAIGAVGFRVIEAAMFIVATAGLFSILTLSQDYGGAATAMDSSSLQQLGTAILSTRDWLNYVGGALAFGFGALLYYIIFYRSRLIPRWLAGWGLIAIIMHIAAALLVMFGADAMGPVPALLNLPIGANELVLGLWLIIRGFEPAVLARS